MDSAAIRKWAVFFAGILCAILIADALAGIIVRAVGLSGWVAFLVNFLLYAGLFFGILGIFERIFHVGFFQFRFS
jgi:hypothetical protein